MKILSHLPALAAAAAAGRTDKLRPDHSETVPARFPRSGIASATLPDLSAAGCSARGSAPRRSPVARGDRSAPLPDASNSYHDSSDCSGGDRAAAIAGALLGNPIAASTC
jgi:hypothetical protein